MGLYFSWWYVCTRFKILYILVPPHPFGKFSTRYRIIVLTNRVVADSTSTIIQRNLIIETAETHRKTAALSSNERGSNAQHDCRFEFADNRPHRQQQLREASSLTPPPPRPRGSLVLRLRSCTNLAHSPTALGQSGGESSAARVAPQANPSVPQHRFSKVSDYNLYILILEQKPTAQQSEHRARKQRTTRQLPQHVICFQFAEKLSQLFDALRTAVQL